MIKVNREELEAIKPLMFYYLNNKIKVLSTAASCAW
jgi:hypothetical protein